MDPASNLGLFSAYSGPILAAADPAVLVSVITSIAGIAAAIVGWALTRRKNTDDYAIAGLRAGVESLEKALARKDLEAEQFLVDLADLRDEVRHLKGEVLRFTARVAEKDRLIAEQERYIHQLEAGLST